MTETFFVGIDGPAGSGKSSVSKEAARRLGFGYLDTGAVYRALAWHVLETGGTTDDEAVVEAAFDTFEPSIGLDPDERAVRVGDVDVTDAIRTPETTAAVAGVARARRVRERINELFRRIVSEAPQDGVIVEGRDITTVVAPDADVRVLLTASEEARLARRALEVHGTADAASLAATRAHVVGRDARDSTVVEFRKAADGVVTVDSSALTFEETVEAVLALVAEATGLEEVR